MDPEIANVLIVVDVQNCFIDGGSFGGNSKSASLVSEIADLVEKIPFDYYVVTRNSHPTYHMSYMVKSTTKKDEVLVKHANDTVSSMAEIPAFLGSPMIGSPNFEKVTPEGGQWPPHCLSSQNEFKHISKCAVRTNLKEVNLKANNEGTPIISTNPSTIYKNFYERVPILRYFENPDMKLSLLDEEGQQNKEPTDTSFSLTVSNIPGSKDARGPVLQVIKGQLCNWDSYSAFQYHADFKRGQIVNDVRGNLDNTTGLAEVLFSKELGIAHFKPGIKKINFVVCGSVGEVSVKYTVSYGLNMLFQAKKQGGLKGYSRIKGFNLTPAPIANAKFIFSSYGTRFMPNPTIIAGSYGIRNEIRARILEVEGTNSKYIGEGISYEILLPVEDELLEKIDSVGALMGSTINSLMDTLGLTKTGGSSRSKSRSKSRSSRSKSRSSRSKSKSRSRSSRSKSKSKSRSSRSKRKSNSKN